MIAVGVVLELALVEINEQARWIEAGIAILDFKETRTPRRSALAVQEFRWPWS